MNMITITKEIAEYLCKISSDKEFVSEICKAAYPNHLYELLAYLKKNPYLVRSEIFDYMIKITGGDFQHKFCDLRKARITFKKDPSEENFNALFECLYNSELYIVETWDLDEDEIDLIKNAHDGDTVNLKDKRCPKVYTRADNDKDYFMVFSSEDEIPQKIWNEPGLLITRADITHLSYFAAIGTLENMQIGLSIDHYSDYDLEIDGLFN